MFHTGESRGHPLQARELNVAFTSFVFAIVLFGIRAGIILSLLQHGSVTDTSWLLAFTHAHLGTFLYISCR